MKMAKSLSSNTRTLVKHFVTLNYVGIANFPGMAALVHIKMIFDYKKVCVHGYRMAEIARKPPIFVKQAEKAEVRIQNNFKMKARSITKWISQTGLGGG